MRARFELSDEILDQDNLASDLLDSCVQVIQGGSEGRKQGGYFAPAPAPAARYGNLHHVVRVRLICIGI